MIALEGLSAQISGDRTRPASSLQNVALTWEKGLLAIVGSPADGTTAFLEVLAGALPIRAGRVLVAGKAPEDARASVAWVPLDPALPDSLKVEEVCDLASRIRGEPLSTAASRLAPLGIEKLADRRVRSLSLGEVRAVALAFAISSKAPILLIEEPLAKLDPAAPAKVIAALRQRANDGSAVIVTTASVRDATALADQLGMLTKGTFTHLPPSLAHVGPGGARLRVVVAANAVSDVAPFIAELAKESSIATVETAAFAATRVLHAAVAVVVGGPDLLAVAKAIAGAAHRTGANVEAIESAVMPVEAIRARIAPPHPGVLLSRPPSTNAPGTSVPPGAIPAPPRVPTAMPGSGGSTPPAPPPPPPPPQEGGAP
jgi:ABC-type multidrug transport system ATPase subunit